MTRSLSLSKLLLFINLKCVYTRRFFLPADIQITVYPHQQNVRDGKDVTFECRARTADNQYYPNVRWTKIGNHIKIFMKSFTFPKNNLKSIILGGPLPRSATDSSGRLTINPVSPADSGQYVCVASHGGQSAEAYAELNVQSCEFLSIDG